VIKETYFDLKKMHKGMWLEDETLTW